MTYIKHKTIFHINNVILYGMFRVMHEMRLFIPTTRVPTDSFKPAMPSVKNIQGRPAFCFGILDTLDTPNAYLFPYQVLCVMHLWATNFRVFTAGCHTPIKHFLWAFIDGFMSKPYTRFFTEGGVYPYLLHPFTHVLFMPCNRESQFGRCPILLSSPSNIKHSVDLTMSSRHTSNTNTVSIYHGRTLNTVLTPTMHSHPTRRDVTVYMKCNHVISCYVMLHVTTQNRCHSPIPGPTRLADANWFRGAKPYI